MGFSKSFPRNVEGSSYPRWEEVSITDEEEKAEEERARQDNINLMKQCIKDAKAVLLEMGMKEYQTDAVNMAVAMFEKRASHSIYWKENKAKEKFDKAFAKQNTTTEK